MALASAAGASEEEAERGSPAALLPLPPAGFSAARMLLAVEPPGEEHESGGALEPEVWERLRDAPAAVRSALGEGPDGGPGVAHRSGARVVADPPYPVPSGTQRSIGRPATEPSIGVARDGTVFMSAIDPGSPAPLAQIVRSRDDGRTWEVLQRGTNGGWPTEDPLIYLDPRTDRLFDVELTLPCSAVFVSSDLGESFSTGLQCNHADHQTLFAGPPPAGGAKPSGYPGVVYYCAIDVGASVVGVVTACSKSMDGGKTFVRTLTPPYVGGRQGGGSLGIPGYCYGATGHGRVGPDGTVYLPRGFCDQPYLAISRDEGDTWKLVRVSTLGMRTGTAAGVGLEEHEARVAIDRRGNVFYLWVAQDRLPYLAVSRDGGAHFGRPMMVAPPGVNEAWGPAIDASRRGRIAFSYLATTNSPGPPYCATTTATSCKTASGGAPKPDSAYANTTWNGYIGVSVNALAADPIFYTASVNDPSDPYTRGACTAIACEPTHEFHGIQIGRDGKAWTSFADGCTSDPADGCPGSVGIAARLEGGPPLTGRLRAR